VQTSVPPSDVTDRLSQRRPLILLGIGAALGIGVAAAGLLERTSAAGHLPSGAVALVNGTPIRFEDYQRVLTAVDSDRRTALDDAQRRAILDRLIDEELLIQRGMELGLVRQDARVRKNLTTAVIDSVVGESAEIQPGEADVAAFYAQNQAFFSRPGRVRARQIWVRAVNAAEAARGAKRAQEAARRLRAGEPFQTVFDALSDPEVAQLPDALLPASKLNDYLGPTALRTLLAMAPGEVSDPIRAQSGYHVLQVVEREPNQVPPLADIRPQVAAELRRRRSDEALRHYLDELRSRASIQITAGAP
jgi:parvulin-like peptidyl-prolyl isomerase